MSMIKIVQRGPLFGRGFTARDREWQRPVRLIEPWTTVATKHGTVETMTTFLFVASGAFHALRAKPVRYSVTVAANWRADLRVARRRRLPSQSGGLPLMDDLTSDRPDRAPTHPGAIWREDILPARLGLTVAGAARDLGVSRQALHNVLRRDAPADDKPGDGAPLPLRL